MSESNKSVRFEDELMMAPRVGSPIDVISRNSSGENSSIGSSNSGKNSGSSMECIYFSMEGQIA